MAGEGAGSLGTTPTEKMLAAMCDKLSSRPWSYPNVYKQRGYELCDLLAVFGDHVFIFQVKEIKFNLAKIEGVAWPRWEERAVHAQIEQLNKAEKWLCEHPDQVYLDARCEEPLPIDLSDRAISIHKILVCHGAEEACRDGSDQNVHGSLAVFYTDDSERKLPFPFAVPLPRDNIFHVFDSFNLPIIFNELNTPHRFSSYIEEKERAIGKFNFLGYAGEEELLAFYLSNFDKKTGRNYIPEKIDGKKAYGRCLAQGFWRQFSEKRRKAAKSNNSPPRKKKNKIGRNEACPCGSGKKFKKCCGLS